MKVAVGLSGGVDSSVAAAILKDRGFEFIGIFMKIWYGTPLAFLLFDLTQEYKSTVLDYFKREYIIGRTPNPCIRCNQWIKFKVLLEKAKKYGVR